MACWVEIFAFNPGDLSSVPRRRKSASIMNLHHGMCKPLNVEITTKQFYSLLYEVWAIQDCVVKPCLQKRDLVHLFNPRTWEIREAGEFKAGLVYIVSFRLARDNIMRLR